MNAVIYARYSSHNQTEQSIEGQLAVCNEYAKRYNYTIVGEYIDRALTGTNDNRPQFKKMIEDSNKKIFNIVLVYQFDRFARNRYDSAVYKNKLKKNNVRVVSARENITEDASGVLMESLLEGMAEYYSVELSQKVKRGMKINAEKFLYIGGNIPLGYKVDKDKKFQIDESTSFIVKEIFDMYIKDIKIVDIVKYLNNKGYKTSYKKPFINTSVINILNNKRYIGTYIYKGRETKNVIPRIISDDIFNKVQEKMKNNKRVSVKDKIRVEYLLTTKLFCGNCKEMMVGKSGTSHMQTTYYYYACNGNKKGICNKKYIKKEYIEDVVVNSTRELLTDEVIDKIANKVVELNKKDMKNNCGNVLEKSLNDNRKKVKNLFESLKICEIESIRKEIFNEIQELEEQYKNIEKELIIKKSQNIDITVSEVKFFLKSMKEGNINDIKYRKLLINVLIDKIYVYDGHLIITFNINNNKDISVNFPDIEEIKKGSPGNLIPQPITNLF